MISNILAHFKNEYKSEHEYAPLLFVSEKLELIHSEVQSFSKDLLGSMGADIFSLHVLEDSGESLKISEVKSFIAKSEIKASFGTQIFLIENISRMTHQAQNACLKFFEEPGAGNIIFLSSESLAPILDTIISRVQVHAIGGARSDKNNFFYEEIQRAEKDPSKLIEYFFSKKIEKEEYIVFLKTLLQFGVESGKYIDFLLELEEDILAIENNNVNPKYISDKYLLRL